MVFGNRGAHENPWVINTNLMKDVRYIQKIFLDCSHAFNNVGKMARLTGLEPATPGVTGRYSNQLSYNRA